jgi:hypothetical protein
VGVATSRLRVLGRIAHCGTLVSACCSCSARTSAARCTAWPRR